MKYLLFVLPVLFLISCQGNDTGKPSRMSEKDSTLYMGLWLKQAKKENFRDMRFGIPLNEPMITCIWSSQNPLRIKVNKKKQIMIRGDIMDLENSRIQKSIIRYLTYNMNQNEAGNNYPLFGRTTLKVIQTNIEELTEQLIQMENENFNIDQISFKNHQLNEWKLKKYTLETLKVKELTEIHPNAAIELECTRCKTDEYSISDSVFQAYFSIRDSLSEVYFKEPYLEIYRRYLIHKDTLEMNKLNALNVLMPIRYVDWTAEDKYKHVYRRNIEPPSLPGDLSID